jgi:hypothetical protein
MSKEVYVEMKIKEKGLKGKAAIVKRDHITCKHLQNEQVVRAV